MQPLLGIDNCFFSVKNLLTATAFYLKLGFIKKLEIPHLRATLLSIGSEEPGLILSEKEQLAPSKLWIAVEDAQRKAEECNTLGICGRLFEINTGFTFEVEDDSGNTIGFADYKKMPHLGRKP